MAPHPKRWVAVKDGEIVRRFVVRPFSVRAGATLHRVEWIEGPLQAPPVGAAVHVSDDELVAEWRTTRGELRTARLGAARGRKQP